MDPKTWTALGDHYRTEKDWSQAETSYWQALLLRPIDPETLSHLGYVLERQGKLDQAGQCFEQALEIDPSFLMALTGQAMILEKQGQLQAAYDLLYPLAQGLDPPFALLMAFAGMAQSLHQEVEVLPLLETMTRQPMAQRESQSLYFRLGSLYDALQQYQQAFECFQRANCLCDRVFSATQWQAEVNSILAAFPATKLAACQREVKGSRTPIFIVGMPRSGTSLTEQILASHPQVQAFGERLEIQQFYQQAAGGGWTAMPESTLDSMAQAHLSRLHASKPFVTDKMPGNFLYLGLIALLFPQARIIHCSRHPLDTCLSCYFHDFALEHAYAYRLESLGFVYRSYREVMVHWKQALPLPIFELNYENLIAQPQETIRDLLDFCGLDWEVRCLDFNQTGRYSHTGYNQVTKPLYASAVGRYRHYEHFLEPLKQALGSYCPSF